MNDVCCICLDNINDTSIIMNLSCNHKIHHKCFMQLAINNCTKFINCPMCRTLNTNTKWPNISQNKLLHNICMTSNRCIHIHKNGKRCDNIPHFFNYGYCHNHNKNILKKKNYSIYLSYINYLFTNTTPQKWYTKLLLLDMAKKLIIKNNIQSLEKLLIIFFVYFKKNENKVDNNPYLFYKYHQIEYPDKEWIKLCKNKKIII